ncbi:hypothetical protein ACET3Z_026505 [Daucus carota]
MNDNLGFLRAPMREGEVVLESEHEETVDGDSSDQGFVYGIFPENGKPSSEPRTIFVNGGRIKLGLTGMDLPPSQNIKSTIPFRAKEMTTQLPSLSFARAS